MGSPLPLLWIVPGRLHGMCESGEKVGGVSPQKKPRAQARRVDQHNHPHQAGASQQAPSWRTKPHKLAQASKSQRLAELRPPDKLGASAPNKISGASPKNSTSKSQHMSRGLGGGSPPIKEHSQSPVLPQQLEICTFAPIWVNEVLNERY